MRYGKAALLVGVCGVVAWTASPAFAVSRTWDGSSSTSWNNAFNWSGNSVPNSGDNAIIGAAPNNAVVLNANATASPVDNITLIAGSGASLNTNGFRLAMETNSPSPDSGLLIINDGNIVIVPEVAANSALQGLDADNVRVNSGGNFGNIGFSIVDNLLDINPGGTIASAGRILVGVDGNTGIALTNDGTITASFLGATDLTIQAGTNATLDLDGVNGNGVVRATADAFLGGIADANLTIDGPLSDPFGGTMEIARRDSITFTDAWEKNGGQLIFRGEDGTDAADLNGATLTNSGGVIQVDQGTAIFNARLNMTGGEFFPGAGTTTTFGGSALFGAGATFNTGALGAAHEFNVRSSVTIQQASFDFDGNSGGDVWNVALNQSLRIDSNFSDTFGGTLNLAEGSTLTLNGNATFDGFSTINSNTSGITFNIGGTTTFNNPGLELDGQFPFNTVNLTNASAVLNINVDFDPDPNNAWDGVINNRGTLNVNTGAGSWAIDAGSLNLIDAGADPTVNGEDLNNGGTITGNGRFNSRVFHDDNGLIQPGSATTAGRLVFADLLRVDQAEIEFDLGGLTPGTQHDQITGGSLTLYTGSRIDLDRIGGYLPAMYVEHVLADVTTLGNLDVFNFVDGVVIPATGTGFAVTYDYAADQILVQRALLGDANLNMQVEQGDLDAVLSNWGGQGTTHGTSWVTGDLNGNGIVEQGDLDFVLGNWGDTAAPDFGDFDLSQVPEPTAAAGMILTACLLSRRSRPGAGHAA